MRILSIDSYTPSRLHCWCTAEVGGQIVRIKKTTAEAVAKMARPADNSDEILARVMKISTWDRFKFWFKQTFHIK